MTTRSGGSRTTRASAAPRAGWRATARRGTSSTRRPTDCSSKASNSEGPAERPKLADEAYDEIADVLIEEGGRMARRRHLLLTLRSSPRNRAAPGVSRGNIVLDPGPGVLDLLVDAPESWTSAETLLEAWEA